MHTRSHESSHSTPPNRTVNEAASAPTSPGASVANSQVGQQHDRRLQAMATLGELTGTATHEFNNVLMTIMNYAKLGLRNQDAASREKALTKILEASQRASQISGTILAQARNRDDSPEPTDLAELVTDALVLMRREMEKYRIAVETDFAEGLPKVPVSGNAIVRVLINLMTNARQAMPDGGTLRLRLAAVEMGDAPAVELAVRDTGKGIEAAMLPKIFEPFFSTKSGPDDSGKGGTGLGLSACKEIIDGHGGRIRVESTPGRGTAFLITLPTTRPQAAAA